MSAPDATLPPARALGAAGKAIIQKWEGCARRLANGAFAAYPDPGSADGKPWTIGWGSTGPDITQGTVWTQAQCDARFAIDIRRFVDAVARFVGANPTTPNQFDALVSFHYNTGAIRNCTLGRLHNQGRFARAKEEFAKWIYNDGKPMNGLKARRAAEAQLYGTP
ncbi:lysozyme [Novosphingobium sp. Leaf2]|uniref:lysozyme n=1 Tax=Novosphingobium sp. Leaf2 TaxID=1735670 RepID=UPI0009E81A15|nr:lysozyme [Novosphingobium sp. Leaf2]